MNIGVQRNQPCHDGGRTPVALQVVSAQLVLSEGVAICVNVGVQRSQACDDGGRTLRAL